MLIISRRLHLTMVRDCLARVCFCISATLVLVGARELPAQSARDHAKEEAAVRQAGKDYLAAMERDDSKAVADAWTAEGTYVDETGRTGKAREWLAKSASRDPSPVPRMTSELQGFLDDWQARLKVLNGKDFQDAQQWLGEYLSVMADGFRRRRLNELGLVDVANMNANQLEDAILRIRAHRLSLQQRRAAFDQNREQMVQSVQQRNAAARQARLERPSTAAQFGTNQSPYRPAPFNPPPRPRRQFFVDGNGQIGFALPY
jgi:hypothetical protein